jgi:chemotaxis protein CheX
MLTAEPHTAPEELISRLDSAVSEVFQTMLERSCAPVASQHAASEHITAQIQFSGAIDGLFVVYATPQSGATHRRGPPWPRLRSPRPMVDDAIGELCNMIAGGWKSKLDISSRLALSLSPPSPAQIPPDSKTLSTPRQPSTAPTPSRATSSELSWASQKSNLTNSFTSR